MTEASVEKKENMKDPQQAELELKMAKDIQAMPEAVQDRFKALHVIYDEVNRIDDDEEREYRALELKYEKMYQEVYAKRLALLNGEQAAVDDELIKKFDERREIFTDAKYAELEVTPCDVKDIQNTPYGVSGFWLKAMLGHKEIAESIYEKDRPILGYLQNIALELHEDGFGYDLLFTFEKNSYFKELVLKKTFVMCQQNVIEACKGTEITWSAGADVTKTKKKKGKGNKKKTVIVKNDSFFNFFETVEVDKKEQDDKADDDDDDKGSDAEQMDEDFELGNSIKDDLVPLALEYYLGVIEQNEDSDEDPYGEEDSDDDDAPKKPKKAKKGPAGGEGGQPLGPDGKPQECKQQ